MNWYIFRHGKTEFSGAGQGYGNNVESAEILPEGIPAIEKMGAYLKDIHTDFNVSSVFLRCQQTVDIVSTISGKKFEFDILLHDIDERFEKVEDVSRRITDFYNNLITKNYNSVAVCSHGYPIAILKSLILTGKVDLSNIDDYPSTGVLLSIEDGIVSYKDFN